MSKEKMTEKKALELLKSLHHEGDYEMAHSEADNILCDLLETLGYKDVVESWRKIGKWYA